MNAMLISYHGFSPPPLIKGGVENFGLIYKGGTSLTRIEKGGSNQKGGTQNIKGGLPYFNPQKTGSRPQYILYSKIFACGAHVIDRKLSYYTYHREFPKIFEIFLATNAKRSYG